LKASAVLNKLISRLGIFFFILAAYMIYRQLSKYSIEELKDALLSIPYKNLYLALCASFMGYVALSTYDFLALKYIQKKLASWKWILTGFIGFSVSNNAGHAIVSGGAVRYRFYSRWNIEAGDIVKMITFSGFTYLVACFFLIILGYLLTPEHAFGGNESTKVSTFITMILSVVGLCIYLWASIYYKKDLVIKGIDFKMPNFKLALEQIFIGSLDILMASLVLYSVLISFVEIDFFTFMGAFIIAQVLGVYSQVPGGLGVFELVFSNILPGQDNQAILFGALIAYRIIYYLLPLIVSGIVLITYEYFRNRREGL
jgi:phosphatidylglycerol lysyltransferase